MHKQNTRERGEIGRSRAAMWRDVHFTMLHKEYYDRPYNNAYPCNLHSRKFLLHRYCRRLISAIRCAEAKRSPNSSFHIGKVLDAACGPGFSTILNDMCSGSSSSVMFSDGDSAMIDLAHDLAEDLNAISGGPGDGLDIRKARWQDLPFAFSGQKFNLVFVLGNSFPYAVGWHGESASVKERLAALESSLKGVFDVLTSDGKLLFDLATYGEGRLDLGTAYIHNYEDPSLVSMHVRNEDGLRHWAFGTTREHYALTGLALNLEMLTDIMRKVGFRRFEKLSDCYQPDPLFYEAHVAY